MDDRTDVVLNILFLSALFVKRNRDGVRCQRIEGSTDIRLGTTGQANTKIWEAQSDQLLYKLEDSFTGRHYSDGVGTFVQGINDEINSGLLWELEYVLQALYKCIIIRLLAASIILRI
jgi:hypothetical protein